MNNLIVFRYFAYSNGINSNGINSNGIYSNGNHNNNTIYTNMMLLSNTALQSIATANGNCSLLSPTSL